MSYLRLLTLVIHTMIFLFCVLWFYPEVLKYEDSLQFNESQEVLNE